MRLTLPTNARFHSKWNTLNKQCQRAVLAAARMVEQEDNPRGTLRVGSNTALATFFWGPDAPLVGIAMILDIKACTGYYTVALESHGVLWLHNVGVVKTVRELKASLTSKVDMVEDSMLKLAQYADSCMLLLKGIPVAETALDLLPDQKFLKYRKWNCSVRAIKAYVHHRHCRSNLEEVVRRMVTAGIWLQHSLFKEAAR